MPTSRDVARVAGVSQSTVSYVLSGKRPISDRTRCRVEAAIEHLTYQPNAGARALASQRTQVIGLVVPFGPGADPWALLPFIEMITTLSREHDHELLLVTAQEGASALQRLAGRKLCDAIVLMDLAVDDARVEVSSRLGVPVVLIGVPQDPAGLHCVDLNFEAAARLAVAELVETAHDRIVVLGHPDEVIRRRLNFVGRFAEAAEEAARVNRVRLEVVAPVEWGKAGAADAVDRALEGRAQDERLGLVVVNAHAVQPVLRVLKERGLVPARDVSVVAIGSNEAAEDAEPPVTNVSVEAREVSRLAMRTVFFLLGLESRKEPEPIQLVTPRLHRRRTVMLRP